MQRKALASNCALTQAEDGASVEADGLESENDSDSDAEMDEAAQVAKAKAVAASLKADAQAAGSLLFTLPTHCQR